MRLHYYSRPQLRHRLHATGAAVWVLWLLQHVLWAVFRLEGSAWQAAGERLRALFPQFNRYRHWRAGDPLRLLIQAVWMALLRAPRDAPSPSPVRRLLALGSGRAHRVREVASEGRKRYHRRLDQLPARTRESRVGMAARAWWKRQPVVVQRRLQALAGIAAGALALLCVTQPFSYAGQFLFVAVLWLLALLVRRMPGPYAGLVLITLSVVVSCRYMWWRYTATLNWESPFDLACGLILLAAETYSWVVLLLGYVQIAWPLDRKPASLPADTTQWPTVDVLIPTYNEDLALVQQTVYAAMGIDWPEDRIRIHILDDGKRDAFRAFAAEVGVGYVTRNDNKHAKAGNLNRALEKMDGELVAIFDCDHMPVRSFLQMTAGWFLRDPKLALVQTPHHFFSPDPFERNLRVFRRDPNEGELFYGLIQDGNDLWNAAFFCGSCALLRRSAVDSIGGFATETVTEDAHTALRLHRAGWNSAYLRLPQAAGLATDSLGAHVNQRIRWARGMAQIFRLDNPLLGKGLTLFQRFCYANAMLHFLAGIPRLVFLTAPLAFLLLHVYIIHASAWAILLFVLPHIAHANLANMRLQGKYRRPFWGEVYETVLAWYIARPTTVALFNPKKGKFNVTDKGGMLETDHFDWRVARPYLVLAVLNVAGLAFAVWRFFAGPPEERATVVVSSLWVIYNLLVIGGAVAVAAEVHQVRKAHRVATLRPAALRLPDGHVVRGMLHDYSSDGVGIELAVDPGLQSGAMVRLLLGRGDREFAFDAEVRRVDGHRLGLVIAFASDQERVDFAQCTFARADAWLDWHSGYRPVSLPKGLLLMLAMGWRGYRRVGDFVPLDLERTRDWNRRLLRWFASFLPERPEATRFAGDDMPTEPAR